MVERPWAGKTGPPIIAAPMANGDESLRVPTQVVRVEVAFGSAAPRALDLFAPASSGRSDRARLAELLARDARFLPARDAATGTLVTLGAHAVTWIAVALGRAAPLDDDELFEHRHDVEIELDGGAVLTGELLYSAPATSTRVVDVLNAPGTFLPLWLPDRVVFVNRGLVHTVTEVPHVRRPTESPAAPRKAPRPNKPVPPRRAKRAPKKKGRR